MASTIQRRAIGDLDRLGQGGQGVVYNAPKVVTDFTDSMVYKEYHDGSGGKSDILATLNVAALKAMPDFLESLPYVEGAKLIKIAAWPCRVVEHNGQVRGFVMPSIPDQFMIELFTAKGPSRVMAEFQHVLNKPEDVARRLNGRIITEREKYELLGRAASALEFLHSHNVCVGDISPKNLLFSLTGPTAVYFVDCDAMRVNGVSLTHQLETPGWEIPSGQEKATPYSDRFKFGLLALRLLVGDQDIRDPSRLPSSVPADVKQLITETLKQPPTSRPEFSRWKSALEKAAKQAPAQPSTVSVPKAKSTIRPLPPQRGPQSQTPAPPQPSKPTPPPPPRPIPVPQPPPTAPSPIPQVKSGKWQWLAGVAVLGFIFLVIKMAVGSPGTGTSTSASTTTAYPTYTSVPSYESATPTRTVAPPTPAAGRVPPGAITGLDVNKQSCNGYQLNQYSGWATRAVRGSPRTSCEFTNNVLIAYWTEYPAPSKDVRTLYVRGSVDCSTVPGAECASDERFVMTCGGTPSEDWITCTGGNQARVYLY
jgi:serine/threonine protein kinase